MAPAKPKRSAKREKAIEKAKSLEDALLTVQATVGRYVQEAQDLRQMLEGDNPPEEESK